jgi:[ribosomal protein S18]-alanine N-acetyltransferase
MSSTAPHSAFEIIPATWRDLGALRRLEKECFPVDAWPLLDLIGVLSMSNVIRLKAVSGDELVGFVAGDIKLREDLAWIATIGVLPTHRRQGIAAALLTECESLLNVSRVRLSVRTENKPAQGLYASFGYERVGLWPAYYQDRSDAIVYEKQLSDGFAL